MCLRSSYRNRKCSVALVTIRVPLTADFSNVRVLVEAGAVQKMLLVSDKSDITRHTALRINNKRDNKEHQYDEAEKEKFSMLGFLLLQRCRA